MYDEYLTNLVFFVRTVSYITSKNSVRNLWNEPRTRLVRGIIMTLFCGSNSCDYILQGTTSITPEDGR